MANQIKIKRGLKAKLTQLALGEMGYCTDTEEVFIGGTSGNVEVSKPKANKIIFIGDSYDTHSNWVSKTATLLGLTIGVDCFNISLSGSSFAGGTWLSQLQNWCAANAGEMKNIGMIVCGGGINDSDVTNVALLPNALIAFNSFVKNNFVQDVEIKLAYFGWALDTSSILFGRTGGYRQQAQLLYARATGFYMQYLNGCESILHNRSMLDVDGLHPNNEGAQRIAEVVSNAILNGSASVTNGGDAIVTPVSGASYTGTIKQTVHNNTLIVNFDFFGMTGLNVTFSNNSWVKLADVKLPFGNKIPQTPVRLMFQDGGGTNTSHDCYLTILNDELLCRIFEIDGGDFVTLTATVLQAVSREIAIDLISD